MIFIIYVQTPLFYIYTATHIQNARINGNNNNNNTVIAIRLPITSIYTQCWIRTEQIRIQKKSNVVFQKNKIKSFKYSGTITGSFLLSSY